MSRKGRSQHVYWSLKKKSKGEITGKKEALNFSMKVLKLAIFFAFFFYNFFKVFNLH